MNNEEKKLNYVPCSKCEKFVLDELINTVDSSFGDNLQLCNTCLDRSATVIQQDYEDKYARFIEHMKKREKKIFKRFMKGKYDNSYGGCLATTILLFVFLLILIVAAVIYEPSNNSYKRDDTQEYQRQARTVNDTLEVINSGKQDTSYFSK